MKFAAIASLAALSLAACSPSEPTAANLADENVAALNEADFPAEDGTGNDAGTSTLGFDNSLDNAAAPVGNEIVANDGAAANLR